MFTVSEKHVVVAAVVLLLSNLGGPALSDDLTRLVGAPRPAQPYPLAGKNYTGKLLTSGDFSRQNLQGTVFRKAVLSQASFRNANLTGADFTGANLVGANFRQAVLSGARFDSADLRGVDFKNATLVNAVYTRHTLFPEGFIPQAYGMVEALEATLPTTP